MKTKQSPDGHPVIVAMWWIFHQFVFVNTMPTPEKCGALWHAKTTVNHTRNNQWNCLYWKSQLMCAFIANFCFNYMATPVWFFFFFFYILYITWTDFACFMHCVSLSWIDSLINTGNFTLCLLTTRRNHIIVTVIENLELIDCYKIAHVNTNFTNVIPLKLNEKVVIAWSSLTLMLFKNKFKNF